MTEEKNLNLSKIEEILITGLQARERELFREVLQPLQDAYRSVINDIENRLGLNAGAIGTDYSLDHTTWSLKPVLPEINRSEEFKPEVAV